MRPQIHLGRRSLLSGAAASLAMPWVPRGVKAAPVRDVSELAWKTLAAKLPGGVIRPNDPRFRALTMPENLRYYNPPASPDAPPDPDAPVGVVLPTDAQQVADAIAWAREVGLPMVPRSGGHSYAGCCTIPGLVIHTGAMRGVRHLGGGVIEMDGGALNSDVFAALRGARSGDAPDGLAITHGRCGAVGASAFLMGGGIGFAMRDRGMGCDLVQSVELVLGNGNVVTAQGNAEPDLFWAIRGGGGGNLGLATRWRLQGVAAEPIVAFNAKWKWKIRGREEEVFARLVRALETAPNTMGAKINVTATRDWSAEPNAIDLLGQLRGPEDQFWSLMAPALADADSVVVAPLSYWEAQTFLEENVVPNRYQEVSRYAGPLSDAFVHDVFHWCRNWPGTKARTTLTVFLAGGQISATPADATAFVHRNAQWLIASDLGWSAWDGADEVERNLAWQRGLYEALGAHLDDHGSFVNFPDPGLTDPARSYWGTNLDRLQGVKRRYDPDDVFKPPRRQGIVA